MSDTEGLDQSHDGGVLTLTLNRPQRRNAMDVDTCRAMTAALRDADADRSVRCIVIAGVDKDFCTGADAVSSNAAVAETATLDYRWKTADYNELFRTMWELETPIVSAVNGTVAGAGWLLALLADLVVAADGARWTHVYLRRGMIPHAGDPYYLPRIVPFHRLMEIALLGDPVESATLGEWGVVNRVVPADEVLPTAMELAQRLASGPTRSIGMARRLYRRSLESDLNGAYQEEAAGLALISTTKDRLEGVQSFIERRPTEFQGD